MRKLILNIDGVKNKWIIPQTINDFSFIEGVEIAKLLNERTTQANVSKVISLALNCDEKVSLYLVKEHTTNASAIYLDIKDLFKNGLGAELTTFSINKKHYRRKHVDELTVKEFIEFEKSLSTANPEIDMFNVLLRRCKPTLRMFGKSILRNKLTFYTGLKQPLKSGVINLQEVDENIPYSFGLVTIYKIIDELEQLENEFTSVFNKKAKGKPTFDESIFGEFECEEENNDADVSKSEDYKWSWYNILNRACNNDIIQKDVWLNKPIQELLTYISYLTDTAIEESNNKNNYGR